MFLWCKCCHLAAGECQYPAERRALASAQYLLLWHIHRRFYLAVNPLTSTNLAIITQERGGDLALHLQIDATRREFCLQKRTCVRGAYSSLRHRCTDSTTPAGGGRLIASNIDKRNIRFI